MNLRLSTKMWLPAGINLLLLVIIAGVVAARTSHQIEQSNASLQSIQERLHDATQWQGLTASNVARVVAVASSGDAEVEKLLKPAIAETKNAVDAVQKRIEAAATTDEEKAALDRVSAARKAYIAAREETVKLRAAGDQAAALALLNGRMADTVKAYTSAQQAYTEMMGRLAAETRTAMGEQRMRTVWTVVGLMGAMGLALIASTATLVRSVHRPMDELRDAAQRIGDGDLTVRIDTRRQDEIGDVLRSLSSMRDQIARIVGQVRESAESIEVASSEVAVGNQDLSQRTEQTASNLQMTASSIEQLTGTVRQSADAASQANQLAHSATQVAQRGGEVVSQVVSTMDEINSSSKRIADIIGTIDGIAFQTNILALNAAVEAARAGEQGRGFAVVAGEVRALAQRSAEAAREIKTLIGTSVEKVETGARLVQDAGSTMNEIVSSVQRVGDIIGEITAAAAEQSAGFGQVNGAVNQLDQMTQQNAALVEESAAAAASLKEQARTLSGVMQVFRLDGVAHRAAAPAPAVASSRPAPAPSPRAAAPAPRPAAAAPARAAPTPAPAATGSDDWETF
ncbi:methyl-accepting chemotaxis protein [Pseudaquabacterium rugosum]|uniref:Methyl-accepting chemotaxis protein n=1 Tax=Pseudaquabacterium rugosum TaxID=2984194 RepID=A0ABU9BGJ2_9BURK